MGLIKSFFKKAAKFLQYLSREYVFPCFYITEMREALQKKEQTCCEAREVIRRNQLH